MSTQSSDDHKAISWSAQPMNTGVGTPRENVTTPEGLKCLQRYNGLRRLIGLLLAMYDNKFYMIYL